jgi:hypothetical protein
VLTSVSDQIGAPTAVFSTMRDFEVMLLGVIALHTIRAQTLDLVYADVVLRQHYVSMSSRLDVVII